MALTDENGGGIPATMLVSPSNMGGGMPYPVPMYGQGGGGNSGFGDGNGWWIILLFILIAAMGCPALGTSNANPVIAWPPCRPRVAVGHLFVH